MNRTTWVSLSDVFGLALLGSGAVACEILLSMALGVEPTFIHALTLAVPTAALVAFLHLCLGGRVD